MHLTIAGWGDAPHLPVEWKRECAAALPAWQRLPRIAGLPLRRNATPEDIGGLARVWKRHVEYDPKLILDPEAIAAERARRNGRKLDSYFPDSGVLRRELYRKHLEFFKAGALHRERLFMAGNRVGKSDTGCYEDTLHLTGDYPHWWEGRQFACPVEGWIAGETNLTVRDILQAKLLGKWGEFGTGLIPRDAIVHWTLKRGVADSVDTVFVKSLSGGVSSLSFKSYAEGRANFQGTAKHLIHFDEESKIEIYVEALMRTMIVPGSDAGGLMLVTFTPIEGWTELIEDFLGANAAETSKEA